MKYKCSRGILWAISEGNSFQGDTQNVNALFDQLSLLTRRDRKRPPRDDLLSKELYLKWLHGSLDEWPSSALGRAQ